MPTEHVDCARCGDAIRPEHEATIDGNIEENIAKGLKGQYREPIGIYHEWCSPEDEHTIGEYV